MKFTPLIIIALIILALWFVVPVPKPPTRAVTPVETKVESVADIAVSAGACGLPPQLE